MATFTVVQWRGIPATVEAVDPAGSASVPLSERFQALIDSAAMLGGQESAEAYLDAWEKSDPVERPGSAAEVAAAVAAELEERFTEYVTRAFRRA